MHRQVIMYVYTYFCAYIRTYTNEMHSTNLHMYLFEKLLKYVHTYCIMRNSRKRKHLFENRKLVCKKIFANDKNFPFSCENHVKDLLDNIRKWPAKRENCKCFLLRKFFVILCAVSHTYTYTDMRTHRQTGRQTCWHIYAIQYA